MGEVNSLLHSFTPSLLHSFPVRHMHAMRASVLRPLENETFSLIPTFLVKLHEINMLSHQPKYCINVSFLEIIL